MIDVGAGGAFIFGMIVMLLIVGYFLGWDQVAINAVVSFIQAVQNFVNEVQTVSAALGKL